MQRLEPGGWGAFPALARDPRDPRSWLAGSDVGGAFFSEDDGASWSPCLSASLRNATAWINAITFTDKGTALIGSTAGVFRGSRVGDDGCGKWAFVNSSAGLVVGNATELLHSSGFAFGHSIKALAAAPAGEVVWAGLGVHKSLGPLGKIRSGDPWHVYRSADGGTSWAPALSLPRGIGTVQSIAAAADGALYVATGGGLFGSRDNGTTWMRLGEVGPACCSRDRGRSWSPCATPPWPACASAAACLPVATAANQSAPNLRKVLALGTDLYATVWDSNTWPVATDCAGGRHSVRDPSLRFFRGGPWRSSDGGASWQHLLRDTDGAALMHNASLRCPGQPAAYLGSQWPSLQVDPDDRTHAMLGGWAEGEGLYEMRGVGGVGAAILRWNDCGGDLSLGCYEGRRPDSLARDANTYFYDMRVEWRSNETRVISGGVVQGQPGGLGLHSPAERPLVYATTSRGGLRIAWDPHNSRYSFKHFNNDLLDIGAVPPRWRSTGLGDTCAWGATWTPQGAALVAVADGGVARTRDGGSSWQRASENWPHQLASQGTAITAALPSGCVFAAHSDRGGTGLASVLHTCDGGDTWEVVGGYLYSASDPKAGNGLSSAAPLRSLAVWPGSGGRRLLAGGGGLFNYDSDRPAGMQWDTSPLPGNASCEVEFASAGPLVSAAAPHFALAACGESGLFVCDDRDEPTAWYKVVLSGDVPTAPTAMAVWGWGSQTASIALGGPARGGAGPRLFVGTCALSLDGAGRARGGACNISLAPSPLDVPSEAVARMRLSSLLAVPPPQPEPAGGASRVPSAAGTPWRLYAALSAADYFDDYPPPALYASTDGGVSFAAAPASANLSSTNIVALALDPRGRVCASTNGGSLQCIAVGA